MSPTVFRQEGYRFYFFSREEDRIHVHVQSADGEAKFWLEPRVSLARSHGLSSRDIERIQQVVEERKDDIVEHWRTHFSR